jgi:hypothetical protein
MPLHNVYRFHAELKDYKPKIWRRFEINGEKTFAELGYALMLMFEMQANHLFCFYENNMDELIADQRERRPEAEIKDLWDELSKLDFAKNVIYELPNEYRYLNLGDDETVIEANKIKIYHVTKSPGYDITFQYDFGDGWEVNLTLEECEKREVSLANLPKVLDGEGYGIIEDVGGVRGLDELAKVLKEGSGEEYDEYREWLGSATLDLETFDIDDANFRLKKLARVYKNIYEYHKPPSDKSLALLTRAYQGKGPRGY